MVNFASFWLFCSFCPVFLVYGEIARALNDKKYCMSCMHKWRARGFSYTFVRNVPSLSVIVRSINSTSLFRVAKVHLSPLSLMATLKASRSSLSRDGLL